LARAVSTLADITVPGLLQIGGGRAEADTEVVEGAAREAHSMVDADLDIGGIVKLSGLHWDAVHRTGTGPSTDATFSIAQAVVGNVPLPVDQLQSVEDAVNAALVPSGVTISMPHVEHITSPNDLIRITPLRILLKDSPLGKATLGPALNLTRAQRVQLFDVIVGVYCNAAAALLTGDITLSVLSGTGFLVIDLGGAEATTADVHFINPFGSVVPLPNVSIAPIVTPDVAGIFVPSPLSIPAPAAAAAVSAPSALTDRIRCESTHSFRWPGCSHGAAATAGLLGLVAIGGLAALDWRHQRRRRRVA
jgi:hypothetical protein